MRGTMWSAGYVGIYPNTDVLLATEAEPELPDSGLRPLAIVL